jgi:hypothetical protein
VKAQRSFLSGIRPSREQHGPKVKVTRSVRVPLQGVKSRSHARPHYSHANTKIDELLN